MTSTVYNDVLLEILLFLLSLCDFVGSVYKLVLLPQPHYFFFVSEGCMGFIGTSFPILWEGQILTVMIYSVLTQPKHTYQELTK